MDLNKMVDEIKKHPEYHKAGMLLCHNGVVRGTSRDGRKVTGLRVSVDQEKLMRVIEEGKKKPGIIAVRVEIAANRDLVVGDDVMALVVAGDIREHVLDALSGTLEAIKTTVTSKTEFFEQ